jgi:hypothetical protein
MLIWKWTAFVTGVAISCVMVACAGDGPTPTVSPENSIRSKSLEEMPADQPAGIGGPVGYGDAGLPHIMPDGSVR